MDTIPQTISRYIEELVAKEVIVSPEAAEALEHLDPETLDRLIVNYTLSAEDSFKLPFTRKIASTFIISGYKVRMVFRRDKGLTKISAKYDPAS